MVMMQAYLDESQDAEGRKVHCIGGLMAPAAEWEKIKACWAELLGDYSINEFHTKDCVAGRGEFGRFSEREREGMLATFVNAIVQPGPRIATATVILLDAYPHYARTLKYRRQLPPRAATSGHLGDPYFMAFEHVIQTMARDVSVTNLPSSERIAFVFDRCHLSGRAGGLYEEVITAQSDYRDRLGACAFDDGAKVLPLQVADVIAYEYRRFAEEVQLRQGTSAPSSARDPFVELAVRFGGPWQIRECELREIAHKVADSIQ